MILYGCKMLEKNRELYSRAYTFLSAIVIILVTWQLNLFFGRATVFLFFIIFVVLNSILGGLKSGLFIMIVATLHAIYFFLLPYTFFSSEQLRSLLEINAFLASGIIINIAIEKYKNADIVNTYKKREKEQAKQIEKLENENKKMHEEIKLRDEFLSIASHELKTPLTSMLLKLQLILHNIRNVSLANFSVEKLLQMLETAEQQTQRLSRMINDLLNISLITTGRLNLEIHEENLSAIVKEVVEEFSEKLEKDGYILHLEADETIKIWADKLRIEQVIANLISNAIKYGNSKPITIKITKDASFAQIIVQDHGIGIRADQQDRVFALFERGVSNSSHKGLGVGLYIANQIIKAHNGVITLESKPHAGSVFTVELPLKKTKP